MGCPRSGDRYCGARVKEAIVEVLLVEDEVPLVEALRRGLVREGMSVHGVHDGHDALAFLAEHEVDVVVLDRDLPGLHGDDVCRSLRQSGSMVGILMLTASSGLRDTVQGLALGADDYLTKPFRFPELVARIRALGRRARPAPPEILERGAVRLDPVRKLAQSGGEVLDLSPKEFDVLAALMEADGGFVSTGEMLETAWDWAGDYSPSAVKVTIHSLRNKLGDGALIESRHSRGYRLA